MASTGKCEYCGSTVSSGDRTCPSCGAPNPNYVEDTPRTVFLPKTIEELKEYCAERGMPLLRMRFFIGEDFREPRAFGIYREGDAFVVYKNKSDGSRAIRYRGPDEAYAVNELFLKLLDECHQRGIYPDGKPERSAPSKAQIAARKRTNRNVLIFLAVVFSLILLAASFSICSHRRDGYYDFNDGRMWYRYGSGWYYTFDDTDVGGWYEGSQPASDYEDYYVGNRFDEDWGVSDFKGSDTWDQIQSDHSSSSSDYDSWDSGGTDWDSDW